MSLNKKKNYFISQSSAVLRNTPAAESAAVNHVIYGDWLRWLGESKGVWEKVRCRGDEGWLKSSEFGSERVLEVNFVDIGVGDGTHIVTPDDKIIIIDAGKTENMSRFLSWRYNLRRRKVKGVEGIKKTTPGAKDSFFIDQAVISHPDLDHYYGFLYLFENPKLKFGTVYHNGIVERPISTEEKDALKNDPTKGIYSDLGQATKVGRNWRHLTEIVQTDLALKSILKAYPKTRKKLLSTYRTAIANPANKGLKFQSLSADDKVFEGYDGSGKIAIDIQGPLLEKIDVDGNQTAALKILGGESVTKNGHSIVFQLRIGKLRIMLGGDLNPESEDYLLRHYTDIQENASSLEKTVHNLHQKGNNLTEDECQDLAEAEVLLQAIVTKARKTFQVDVVKAHHHGSHEFSETFLKSVNAIATVISSGDDEDYSHPRPDALGAFGKYGRGDRPLLFSTEIARATREFTYIFKYFKRLEQYQSDLAAATTDKERNRITKEIEGIRDRNVAVYGMITLRTNGDKTIIAQKLERPGKAHRKWDIQELKFNADRGEFVHIDRTKL